MKGSLAYLEKMEWARPIPGCHLLLCFTKSYFSALISKTLRTAPLASGLSQSRYKGETMEAICVVKEGVRKEFMLNGEPYERFPNTSANFPASSLLQMMWTSSPVPVK
jgi:hypothetical protein